MAYLTQHLELDRCPHCNTDKPSITLLWSTTTKDHKGENERIWSVYRCARCGGVTLAASDRPDQWISEMYPASTEVEDAVPGKAKIYLRQAIDSIHAPAGAVMLAASAVDAMLKEKGYKDGSLFSRIDKASVNHLITAEMATWAHQVRLEANDERHADDGAELPDENDARLSVDFAKALAEFLFVLPSKVTRGLKASTPQQAVPTEAADKSEV